MSTFRTPVGCISLALMLVVSCDTWTPQALGNHVRYRSVSRQLTTIRGNSNRGYVMVPVLIQSSSVPTVGSPGSSTVTPNSAPSKPQPANVQGGLPSGEVTPPPVGGGDGVGGGEAGNGGGKVEPEAEKKGDEGTSAEDAEKCKKDREALTEELKQLKASLATEKLSEALGKAEADTAEAKAAHQIAVAALSESVNEAAILKSELHTIEANIQAETLTYSGLADKNSPEAVASAGRIADHTLLMHAKQNELDSHAVQHKKIKSRATTAAAKYHDNRNRLRVLTDKAYGKHK